jgi:hypothetical protein
MEDAAQSPQQGGFAETRNAFEQNVAACEEAYEDAINHMLLADDNFADFFAHLLKMTGGELNWGLGGHDLILAVTRWKCLGVMYYNTRASCRPLILLSIQHNSG